MTWFQKSWFDFQNQTSQMRFFFNVACFLNPLVSTREVQLELGDLERASSR